ncbi:MAG: YqiA/YcfP family alpha/beta fold hydrolase [Gammaproteobacteria bacterium]
MKKMIIYNHGKDSTPWGEKTMIFSVIAERLGFDFQSPDYRHQPDPDERVERLLGLDYSSHEQYVLAGSSMGAYVATVAAETIRPQGLFLLAPAFYLPGYRRTEFCPPAERTQVIHGWQDAVVPPGNSWRFCRSYGIRLNMLNSDHRLMSEAPRLAFEFERFLRDLDG